MANHFANLLSPTQTKNDKDLKFGTHYPLDHISQNAFFFQKKTPMAAFIKNCYVTWVFLISLQLRTPVCRKVRGGSSPIRIRRGGSGKISKTLQEGGHFLITGGSDKPKMLQEGVSVHQKSQRQCFK